MDRLPALRAHVRAHAENRPGIYRMLGPGGELLYVGKSVQVRTRLLSYFRAKRGQKAAEIVGHAHRIEWEYTPSEFSALLAELRTIKRMRPVYNVEHKRDRSYCFIKVSREPAPRLMVVGNVTGDGATYYGPYRGRKRVTEAVREIADLLELRDCPSQPRKVPIHYADQIEIFRRDRSPLCIRGELGRCLAPCAASCTEQEYLERVEVAKRFLDSDADHPLAILRRRMQAAAERMQFEYAAQLRDRANRLETIKDEMIALRGAIESLTFLYPVPGHGGDDRLYVLKRGTIRADVPLPPGAAERAVVLERAKTLCDGLEPETGQVQPHQVAEMLLIARWFRLNPAERERGLPLDGRTGIRQSA